MTMRRYLLPFVGIVVIVVATGALAITRHSAAKDLSDEISTRLNAACEQSGYQIVSKLDGSKDTIYSCQRQSGKIVCVVEANGIDSDVTAEARALFANTLSVDNKPACVT